MYKAAESPSLRVPENLSIKTSFFVISLSTPGEGAGQPSEKPYSLILKKKKISYIKICKDFISTLHGHSYLIVLF